MVRKGLIVGISSLVMGVLAAVGWTLAAEQPQPAPKATANKPVDLTALREALEADSQRGANVDEITKALEAFEKVLPNVQPGTVPPELQALRDAVDAAARKGENVDRVTKELLAIEMAIAGRSLAKPKPEPQPEPQPNPNNRRPRPFVPDLPLPILPDPGMGDFGIIGGIDVPGFNRAMELRRKATELLMRNPRDPEARKLLAESQELMLKAAGAGRLPRLLPMPPNFPDPIGPDVARPAERVRFGIRMERVPAVAAEQLGLEPNTGIVVSSVIPNTVAEKVGLKANDIILEFAGKPVSNDPDEFARRINEAKAGEKFTVVVLRKGKKVEIKDVELPEAGVLVPNDLPGFPNALPQLQRELDELQKRLERELKQLDRD
ncbi:MAG: PDZ domain-containing protein [Gemmataceae bacterium]|nr:PDZ domain-containing protein [Gemmata sp.]MDW8196286.1 PDZ domain-containing protein [Gemmataceae bacterium]